MKINKRYPLQVALVAVAIFFTSVTFAAEDPIRLLESITDNVMSKLKNNASEVDSGNKGAYEVVNEYILPHVDFNEMSQWVAGRTAWGKATENYRSQFISEFKVLVVRTYATALNNYSNETIEFINNNVNTERTRIQVSSWVVRAGQENLRLDYRLIKHGDTWMVYDVIIEGVSILQGFQAQFSDDIRNNGLPNVIAKIKDHNIKGKAK